MSIYSYRADIDGLRAVSVLSIFAFHLGFSSFSGGFVGVDIFFVISGYLIIPRIVDGLETSTFSLADFFERRIRRILPAFLLILIFSAVVGYFILGPREYTEYSASALAALVFGANIFFNDRSDYFADAAHQKPLLHMWSLGVEEQFYILIPLILMGLWALRRASPRKVILVITAASFIYNVIFLRINETHTFYLPMSRFWELGIGGIVAFYGSSLGWGRNRAIISGVAGCILLAVSIFVIDDLVAYPGEIALLPVMGAALLILSGHLHRNWLSDFLGSRPFRYIGRLSYSLYLIHWPVIVFVRLYLSRPLELKEQVAILIFSFIWAALSWHLVENKILSKRGVPFKFVFTGLCAGLIVCVSALVYINQTNGLTDRMSKKSLAVLQDVNQVKRDGKFECRDKFSLGGDKFSKFKVCDFGPVDGKKILFWGDSHSGMIVRAHYVIQGADKTRVISAGMPDCPPLISVVTTRRKNRELCSAFVDLVLEYIKGNKVDTVVLASRWANLGSDVRSPGDGGRSHTIFDLKADSQEISLKAALLRTVDALNEIGVKVVIIGPVPEIAFHVPDTLVRVWSGIGDLPVVSRQEFDHRQAKVLPALKLLQDSNKAAVIYPHEKLCDDLACKVAQGSRTLYLDDDHLSVEGARGIVEELVALY
ncbi:MAG: acyltransferase [Sneathiella sp.]|nr:acyltransferase [Sneathiella sp.]